MLPAWNHLRSHKWYEIWTAIRTNSSYNISFPTASENEGEKVKIYGSACILINYISGSSKLTIEEIPTRLVLELKPITFSSQNSSDDV